MIFNVFKNKFPGIQAMAAVLLTQVQDRFFHVKLNSIREGK